MTPARRGARSSFASQPRRQTSLSDGRSLPPTPDRRRRWPGRRADPAPRRSTCVAIWTSTARAAARHRRATRASTARRASFASCALPPGAGARERPLRARRRRHQRRSLDTFATLDFIDTRRHPTIRHLPSTPPPPSLFIWGSRVNSAHCPWCTTPLRCRCPLLPPTRQDSPSSCTLFLAHPDRSGTSPCAGPLSGHAHGSLDLGLPVARTA